LTFLRVGFFAGGRLGSGLAVMKRQDGTWSAPSAIGVGGLSIGFTFGADVVNLCLILMSQKACQVLASKGQLLLEGELSATAGPLGRNASIGAIGPNGFAPVYSYNQSRGLLVGVDLNGSLLLTRKSVNHKFYGLKHSPEDILMGDVPQPEAGKPLYDVLQQLSTPPPFPVDANAQTSAASNAGSDAFLTDAAYDESA